MQNIGECMRESGQLDSAYHYLDGALKLARQEVLHLIPLIYCPLWAIYIQKKNYMKRLWHTRKLL